MNYDRRSRSSEMKSGSTASSGYNWPKADEPVKAEALFKATKQNANRCTYSSDSRL